MKIERYQAYKDSDVLDWFEAQGDRAKLQMAIALKIYADAHKAYLIEN
ncbi:MULTISPECIES: hypothetical protein [unclassified Microcoleus]